MKKLINKLNDKPFPLTAGVNSLLHDAGATCHQHIGAIIIAVVIVGLLIVAIKAFFPGFFTGMFNSMKEKLNANW
jgi:hypothetical protein